jgi:hypothetical protein
MYTGGCLYPYWRDTWMDIYIYGRLNIYTVYTRVYVDKCIYGQLVKQNGMDGWAYDWI